jgi:hypothetical protein
MYADGDPIGELPVRVRAVKGAVNVIVPLEAPAAPAFAAPHPAAAREPDDESAPAGSPSDDSPVIP